MSTGLTFGSISALYGLTNGIIDQAQYTILVTVVIGSAVIPTFIAQTWFLPEAGRSPARLPEALATEPAVEPASLALASQPAGEEA